MDKISDWSHEDRTQIDTYSRKNSYTILSAPSSDSSGDDRLVVP